jgi:hypothetical protein
MTEEPRITFKKEARTIVADFLISTDNEGRNGAERRHYAAFRVRYDKGGMNYFSGGTTPRSYSSSINRETEEASVLDDGRRIGTMRSFTLFKGLGLHRSEPVARYSEKALRAFFDEAMTHLDTVRDDPRVAAYFEPEAVEV